MVANACPEAERKSILEQIPQKPPFRFLNEIQELSDDHIVAKYRFTGEEFFYAGHFPGDPVTPGVILLEAMAQAGLVALGIYLLRKERPEAKIRTLFSECAVEFLAMVRPGEEVSIRGEKVYWRRNKLQSRVELRLEDGSLAASGTVSGMGVAVL